MKYHELSARPQKKANRIGRGIAAGQGKTAGRGTKGQKSRAGSTKRPGFAGGQNPLMQQLPKLPGFRSYRSKAENVFTNQLDRVGSKVDATVLAKANLISSPHVRVKLLYRGELNKKFDVSLPLASKRAIEAVQSAGGSFNKVEQLKRTAKEQRPQDK